MIIHSKFKDYELVLNNDLSFLNDILSAPANTEYVIDNKVYELYKDYFERIPESRLFLIEAVEENKVVDTALSICEIMTEIPAKRNACLVSVGGGIIQDITGFVANVLYRGISWTFIPTTLLASCDSCIGGKTSLNYKGYKNLLGTFYPPDKIYVCPLFFNTLTEKDFKSGLGEVVKFNIMTGESGLESVEKSMEFLLKRDPGYLSEFVLSSLTFKKSFIEIDEFDRGERVKLNFAHTFGHAIETVTDYDIPHGTAVAIGMIMANHISGTRGLLPQDFVQRAESVLLKIISIDPAFFSIPIDSFIRAMKKDKKQINDNLTVVLMTDADEKLIIVNDLQVSEVKDAIKHFQCIYLKGEK